MSYIGAAASVVGGEIQGWAALLAKRKMAEVAQQAANIQSMYRGKGMGAWSGAVPKFGREQADIDIAEGAARRKGLYAEASRPQRATTPGGATTPAGGPSAADVAYGQQRGTARANLGAQSDWSLNQSLRDINLQQELNQIASFAGGEAGLTQYDMYEAQHKYDWLSQIGQAISSIGGAAGDFAQYKQAPGQMQTNFGNASNMGVDFNPAASTAFADIA